MASLNHSTENKNHTVFVLSFYAMILVLFPNDRLYDLCMTTKESYKFINDLVRLVTVI